MRFHQDWLRPVGVLTELRLQNIQRAWLSTLAGGVPDPSSKAGLTAMT